MIPLTRRRQHRVLSETLPFGLMSAAGFVADCVAQTVEPARLSSDGLVA